MGKSCELKDKFEKTKLKDTKNSETTRIFKIEETKSSKIIEIKNEIKERTEETNDNKIKKKRIWKYSARKESIEKEKDMSKDRKGRYVEVTPNVFKSEIIEKNKDKLKKYNRFNLSEKDNEIIRKNSENKEENEKITNNIYRYRDEEKEKEKK